MSRLKPSHLVCMASAVIGCAVALGFHTTSHRGGNAGSKDGGSTSKSLGRTASSTPAGGGGQGVRNPLATPGGTRARQGAPNITPPGAATASGRIPSEPWQCRHRIGVVRKGRQGGNGGEPRTLPPAGLAGSQPRPTATNLWPARPAIRALDAWHDGRQGKRHPAGRHRHPIGRRLACRTRSDPTGGPRQ